MLENFDLGLVNWSRAQFAMTAIYHWLFVPLTLGITFILAFMETIYVKTGNPEWKKITKFWMTVFGINFAIGVATGIILEFEFGTNWSNYSWFVGDIFGAPLAIEGIMAFFMESTFIAIMFFGWNKVSKKVHLLSTWLTAIGANLSALWILVANGWMQKPVGMWFNPETARHEMTDFWDILLSDQSISTFVHTTTSGFVLASLVVIAISSWFLLKKKDVEMAKKSILIATVFGFLSSLYLVASGDYSAKSICTNQPMKMAAAEGLYEGSEKAPLIGFGVLTKTDHDNLSDDGKFVFKIETPIPGMLSFLAFGDFNSFVPGIKDLIEGNPSQGIMSFYEKIERGHEAQQTLKALKDVADKSSSEYKQLYAKFKDKEWLDNYFKYFGYGTYYDSDKTILMENAKRLIPSVPLTFYSFHVMVSLGVLFIFIFILFGIFMYKGNLDKKKWLLWIGIWCAPLAYIASEAGWVMTEVGRQPWVIQDMMPTLTAVTKIDSTSVMVTFLLFVVIFTALLIAELKIMFSAIRKGMSEH